MLDLELAPSSSPVELVGDFARYLYLVCGRVEARPDPALHTPDRTA